MDGTVHDFVSHNPLRDRNVFQYLGMAEATYCGLADFGLPLVTREDPSFDALVRDIESRPGPGPARFPSGTDRAAVLLNNSGRAIIAAEWFWRYTSCDGKTRTSHFSNLGSSVQREVLTGRCKAGRDPGTFILPGSKRLITELGIFGNNLDVLTPEELSRPQGYCGGSGGGGGRAEDETELAAVELVLDLLILEDGLCVGPDEFGLYEALNESLDLQRTTAQEAVQALQGGASVGQVFEIIRPLARHQAYEPQTDRKRRRSMPILPTFGMEAVHRLTNANAEDLLPFFEEAAEPGDLQLRRPE
jgi:hypothetical protein